MDTKDATRRDPTQAALDALRQPLACECGHPHAEHYSGPGLDQDGEPVQGCWACNDCSGYYRFVSSRALRIGGSPIYVENQDEKPCGCGDPQQPGYSLCATCLDTARANGFDAELWRA